MKKCLLSFSIILSICLLSNNTYGQNDAGGSAGASVGVGIQPIATHFTRHNGNGAAPGESIIRLHYSTAPTYPPTLTQILLDGVPLIANFVPVTGDITEAAITGYVTFSIPTTNIPPAQTLTLTYHAGPWQSLASIDGTE